MSVPAARSGHYEVTLVMLAPVKACIILGWPWSDALWRPDVRCSPAADITFLPKELTLEENRELRTAQIYSVADIGAIDHFVKYLTIFTERK